MSAGPDTKASDSKPPTSSVAKPASSVAAPASVTTTTLATKHVVAPPKYHPYPECIGRDLLSVAMSVVYKCDPDTNEPVMNDLRLQEIQKTLFDVWGKCTDVQVQKYYPKGVLCGAPISTCPNDANNVTYADALISSCSLNVGSGINWYTCDPLNPDDCRNFELRFQDGRRFEQGDLIMYFNRKVKMGCELCRCDFESRRIDCGGGVSSFRQALKEACSARWQPHDWHANYCDRKSFVSEKEIFELFPEDDSPEVDNYQVQVCDGIDDDNYGCDVFKIGGQKATWLREPTTTVASDDIHRLPSKFPGLEVDTFPSSEVDEFSGFDAGTDRLESKTSVGIGVVGCVLTAAVALGAVFAYQQRKLHAANRLLAAQRDGADERCLEEEV